MKSACSEANEAYEIVKKQNYVMKREMEEVKKRLSEKDSALETSEVEKETMEEQILNARSSSLRSPLTNLLTLGPVW